ncbi:hypothetical protein W59_23880 [Rhodococcus opacus RKJ300 = JCM 13270]|uniref:Uncharacterized protein n=1 Tax=Rhodococcus opacus RKJ300 = JCM 13270 TaxID=1165867 RepID=I0WM26_RHOOP|nr:hypothetical protein W59_23880 [Rhodococcus opacus RKJ300 = JCM 13270]
MRRTVFQSVDRIQDLTVISQLYQLILGDLMVMERIGCTIISCSTIELLVEPDQLAGSLSHLGMSAQTFDKEGQHRDESPSFCAVDPIIFPTEGSIGVCLWLPEELTCSIDRISLVVQFLGSDPRLLGHFTPVHSCYELLSWTVARCLARRQ